MNSEEPFVSVIMPVRNGESFVADAIESVLRQSFTSFELIVVDDGSTDRTLEICHRYGDRRVRIIRNVVPLGVPGSLNLAIAEARGGYLARLDADDIALPDRLLKQVAFLEANPDYGIVGSWMETFGLRRRLVKLPVSDLEIRSTLLFRNAFAHPAVLFRKNWDSGGPGFYDEGYAAAQDYELWARISKLWRCHNIPQSLTGYRLHDSQHSTVNGTVARRNAAAVSKRQLSSLGLSSPPLSSSRRAQRAWRCLLLQKCREDGNYSMWALRREIWRLGHFRQLRAISGFLHRFGVLGPVLAAKDTITSVARGCMRKLRQ